MLVALAFALLHGTAPVSTNFTDRVQQAKLAEAATTGPAYQKVLWDTINQATTQAYKACSDADKATGKLPFTLVLDVDEHGKPHHLAVQPATPVAACMQKHFASWVFPAPPATPSPYPLEVDFSITP